MKAREFNMSKAIHLTTSILFTTALVFGCAKSDEDAANEETSNPSGVASSGGGGSASGSSDVTLSIRGSSPQLALVGPSLAVKNPDGTVAGALELTTATVVMDKIKLKLQETALTAATTEEADDSSGSSEDSLEFKGPFLVDLLTNTMTPDISSLKLPGGNYKALELSVHKVEDADAEVLGIGNDHPLFGKSILVEGTYTPVGGTAVAFSMSYEVSEEFEISGSQGVDIVAGGQNDLVVAFRFASWFDFTSTKTNPEGVAMPAAPTGDINLSEDADEALKAIRTVIKENLKYSADFGKDADGDGELADDEDAESPEEEESPETESSEPA